MGQRPANKERAAMNEPIRVRCANPQPDLLTGKVCGWHGRRKGRRVDLGPRGVVQLKPTHERCPRCGSRVEEVPVR